MSKEEVWVPATAPSTRSFSACVFPKLAENVAKVVRSRRPSRRWPCRVRSPSSRRPGSRTCCPGLPAEFPVLVIAAASYADGPVTPPGRNERESLLGARRLQTHHHIPLRRSSIEALRQGPINVELLALFFERPLNRLKPHSMQAIGHIIVSPATTNRWPDRCGLRVIRSLDRAQSRPIFLIGQASIAFAVQAGFSESLRTLVWREKRHRLRHSLIRSQLGGHSICVLCALH